MSRRSQPKKPEPKLFAGQFPQLNHEFYSSNPAEYFRRRLYLLTVYAGSSDEFIKLLSKGISYEKIYLKVDLANSTDSDKQQYQNFLTTEAEVLLHHTAEALLRLYFAHADEPLCPWLECARLRTPGDFKDRLVKFVASYSTVESRAAVAKVFLGKTPNEDDELRNSAVVEIDRLLRVLGRRLREDDNLYNSAKHGLTVIAGESSFTLGSDGGQAFVGAQGQSISFLEKCGEDGEPKLWHKTTRWLSPRQAMWLTTLAINQMASLWAIATNRYIGTDLDRIDVVTHEAVEAAITGEFAANQAVTRWSVKLAYHPLDEVAE